MRTIEERTIEARLISQRRKASRLADEAGLSDTERLNLSRMFLGSGHDTWADLHSDELARLIDAFTGFFLVAVLVAERPSMPLPTPGGGVEVGEVLLDHALNRPGRPFPTGGRLDSVPVEVTGDDLVRIASSAHVSYPGDDR